MSSDVRESGIPSVGPLEWGTHMCQFYQTKQDLIDSLAPYFSAGLRNNEYCLWVTSFSLERDEAHEVLRSRLPQFDDCVRSGQIEIVDYRDWYSHDGFHADRTLAKWLAKEAQARARGFAGLRLSGDTAWVHGSGWEDFVDYERRVNEAFGRFRLIGVCTYNLDLCSAGDALDVVRNHRFMLTRRRGDWEMVESASLKTTKEELSRRAAELEERVKERTRDLAGLLASRDEFLAMLAHELRNPLAPIRNAAHVLRALNAREDMAQRATEVLDRQVAHMAHLIDDLLDVARITQGHVNLNREPIELATVVARAVEAVKPALESRGHHLKVALLDCPTVHADATRLAQVLGNLLDNAAKYTPRGGEIDLELEQDADGLAVVRVRDNGIGIPREMLDRIFEPFQQVRASLDRSEGGLGLGLAVVRRLVEMHGGTVAAASGGTGQGSEFTVRLPQTRDKREATRAVSVPQLTGDPRRILVIEDNVDGADMTCAMLSVLGHDAQAAYTGMSGIAAAQRLQPDVVLLDIGLPDIDGYEVARRLRADARTGRCVLVALTGYGQEADRERARSAGFDTHCLKPVSLETLVACCAGAKPTRH